MKAFAFPLVGAVLSSSIVLGVLWAASPKDAASSKADESWSKPIRGLQVRISIDQRAK